MKNGKEFLLTDTVGFIQKLPTTLVSAPVILNFITLSRPVTPFHLFQRFCVF